jgi:hypothetical protein
MSSAELAAEGIRPSETTIATAESARGTGVSPAMLLTLIVVSQLAWLSALGYGAFRLVT